MVKTRPSCSETAVASSLRGVGMSAIRRQVAAPEALGGAMVTVAERATAGLGDDPTEGGAHEARMSTARTGARIVTGVRTRGGSSAERYSRRHRDAHLVASRRG